MAVHSEPTCQHTLFLPRRVGRRSHRSAQGAASESNRSGQIPATSSAQSAMRRKRRLAGATPSNARRFVAVAAGVSSRSSSPAFLAAGRPLRAATTSSPIPPPPAAADPVGPLAEAPANPPPAAPPVDISSENSGLVAEPAAQPQRVAPAVVILPAVGGSAAALRYAARRHAQAPHEGPSPRPAPISEPAWRAHVGEDKVRAELRRREKAVSKASDSQERAACRPGGGIHVGHGSSPESLRPVPLMPATSGP